MQIPDLKTMPVVFCITCNIRIFCSALGDASHGSCYILQMYGGSAAQCSGIQAIDIFLGSELSQKPEGNVTMKGLRLQILLFLYASTRGSKTYGIFLHQQLLVLVKLPFVLQSYLGYLVVIAAA